MKKNYQMIWRVLAGVLVIAVGLFAVVPPVYAAEIITSGEIKAGVTVDDDIVLTSDMVHMDGTVNGLLMAFGNTITINGPVNGDLIVMGQSILLTENAVIDGNVFTAGQNITVNGKITGSLLAASMVMTNGPKSEIMRNQYYAGYSLTQSAGSKTGKDIRAGLYQAILEGETGQDAVIYGEAVEVKGNIKRNAEFIVGTPTNEPQYVPPYFQNMGVNRNLKPGLRVDPIAMIGGVMTYTSKVNQSSSIAATPAGGVVFLTPVPSETEKESVDQTAAQAAPAATAFSVLAGFSGFASNLISLLLVGALLLWKFPALLNQNVAMIKARPWPSTGYGFVTIIVGYAALFLSLLVIIFLGIIIAFLTIGGLGGVTFAIGLSALATAAALFSFAVSHISKVIVAVLVGQWLYSKLAPNQASAVWPMVIGVVLYAILSAIPYLGFLFSIAATLLGTGAMWLVFRDRTAKKPEMIAG